MDNNVIGFEKNIKELKKESSKTLVGNDTEEEMRMREDFEGLLLPDDTDKIWMRHDKLHALHIAVKMMDLMFRMNILTIPKNMHELKQHELKVGKTIVEDMTEDIYGLAKKNLEFLKG